MQEKAFHDQTNVGYREQPGTKVKSLLLPCQSVGNDYLINIKRDYSEKTSQLHLGQTCLELEDKRSASNTTQEFHHIRGIHHARLNDSSQKSQMLDSTCASLPSQRH